MRFSDKTICITGVLPIPRKSAIALLQQQGATYENRVTRHTDILVVGIFPRGRTTTNKYSTALKYIEAGYPVAMISPSEFLSSIEN